jgi:hypothetical protein
MLLILVATSYSSIGLAASRRKQTTAKDLSELNSCLVRALIPEQLL